MGGGNRTRPMSWFMCNVKASTQFHTTHSFPAPSRFRCTMWKSLPLQLASMGMHPTILQDIMENVLDFA